MEELTARQQSILKIIVSEYVSSARPVGSDTVVEKYDLKISPATVRNAMGALEAAGFIYHPHTSAGRVPSARGYRFFVERLMEATELPVEEQRTISHQFHQVELALDEWVQLAASVLAHSTSNAALVTLPMARQARLRHLDLFSIHRKLALLVVVLQEGILRKQIVELGKPIAEDELDRTAHRLDEAFRGLTAAEIEAKEIEGPPAEVETRIRQAVVTIMRALDEQGLRDLWYDGVTQLLNQPEFANVERLREFLEILEHPEAFAGILGGAYAREGISLLIGEENPTQLLRDYTLVLTRYSMPGEAGGVIGVIGPTRMRYDRAISSLRYVAELLGSLWRELHD